MMLSGFRTLGVCTVLVVLAGCGATERYHFSDEAATNRQAAVRNIMAQQTLNPGASQRNAGQLPGSEDGQKAVNTLQDYRGGSSSGSGGSSGAGDAGSDLLQGLQGLLN